MDLINLVYGLRRRICEYRLKYEGQVEISTHVNAVDITLALVDLGIKDKRPISTMEENWFRAEYYLSLVFDNSEWEEIREEYSKIVEAVKKLKYFRT
jgi:hypothetical protein